jgi:pentatricopeptide repeat protein
VIDGFCKAENVDEANKVVEEMQDTGCRADKVTYTIIIVGHCM